MFSTYFGWHKHSGNSKQEFDPLNLGVMESLAFLPFDHIGTSNSLGTILIHLAGQGEILNFFDMFVSLHPHRSARLRFLKAEQYLPRASRQ
jgi:hypothetical protein